VRNTIERAVPHGRSNDGGRHDRGAWKDAPGAVDNQWARLNEGFERICERVPSLRKSNNRAHLGTLGTGNHFIEMCLDESQAVWLMLHSGSRGVGNAIGSNYIELARNEMMRLDRKLPDRDLAYFQEGSRYFDDYVFAVGWAQDFARTNRDIMMKNVIDSLLKLKGLPRFTTGDIAVNCHHNYVAKETHFGEEVLVTRKGAVRAGKGDLGIIPGSMGARSFIVRGKGNEQSFCSCSHGAGRKMSRTEAKKTFTLADHERDTAGVECRKDKDVIDETPQAYKDIDAVMAAQADLVEVVHTLKQVVCVKG
jgi:tRNA-splicing ligase RtcB (3'-phosphate/5'-hydroxy nucleic acid ligase)